MESKTKKQTNTSYEQKIAMKVSGVSIFVNIFLSFFKLVAGIISNSSAMVSDAIHSASDVFSTIVVIIGVRMAGKKSDQHHPYGHERLECVSSILLSGLLALTGIGIGIGGIEKVIAGTAGEDLMIPGFLAMIAAILSLVVKEWMFWYTRAAAKKIHSGALMADAWHHRSDALSSIGAFVGIFGSRLGYPILDPLASVVICGFIIKAAVEIFKDAIDKMVDRSCDEETRNEIYEFIEKINGVEKIDVLRTRLFGSKIYVDIEISVDGNLSLKAAHSIAEQVHHSLETAFPQIKHCMVHVNPLNNKNENNR